MIARHDNIEMQRSPADDRDYRAVMLDNGLEAVLVSDPKTEKAAAALDINVGTANDPEACPGLAHFLEHMLFLGTAKYPDAGEYSRFLAEHGGADNAMTSFAHTSHFFDINAAHLEGALDRFAQFYISPRFDAGRVDGERQVIHAEYCAQRRGDRARSFAAWRQILDPRHPLARFPFGNAETLADRPGAPIRDALIDFYERTYSAHLMKLVVLGREPLEVLEDLARTRFSAVPRRRFEPPRISAPLYPEKLLPARLNIEPVRELRAISLSFPMPPILPHHQSHPLALVAHLLGHEGRGSLLSALKGRGWAEGLNVGVGVRHRDFATFTIAVNATPTGIANHDGVVDLVFACIDLIRKEGIQRRCHDELARMARLGFRFMEKSEPGPYAVWLGNALHYHPTREVLSAPWLFGDFDRAAIQRYSRLLTPENALVSLTSKDLATDSAAAHYGTRYRVEPIPNASLARWRDPPSDGALSLPKPNPFVPARLEMTADPPPDTPPARIVNRPGFDLWHRADAEFGKPRAKFHFEMRSPIANDSPRHAALGALLARMTNDALEEFAYPAVLAGQTFALSRHHRGITVRLSGWNDKQNLLLERVASTLRARPFTARRFDRQKSDYARGLRNLEERKPYRRAASEVRTLLIEPNWSAKAVLEALETIEFEDLREYGARFFERGNIVALAHGNVAVDEAGELGAVLERELLSSIDPRSVAKARVARLEPGTRFGRWLAGRHDDHALVVYRQGRGGGVAERAKILLIARILGDRFFHEMRTEREIGYIVNADFLSLRDVPGIAFAIQSPKHRPEVLCEHFDAFIERFGDALPELPSALFERHRAALDSALSRAEVRLGERATRYWNEIDRENFKFDRLERFIEALRSLTWNECADAARDVVVDPASARGVVVGVSKSEPPDGDEWFPGAESIIDTNAFKRSRRHFDG